MHRVCLKWLLPPWGQGQDHLKEATAAPIWRWQAGRGPAGLSPGPEGRPRPRAVPGLQGSALGDLCLGCWKPGLLVRTCLLCMEVSRGHRPLGRAQELHPVLPVSWLPRGLASGQDQGQRRVTPGTVPTLTLVDLVPLPCQPPPSGRLRRATCCAGRGQGGGRASHGALCFDSLGHPFSKSANVSPEASCQALPQDQCCPLKMCSAQFPRWQDAHRQGPPTLLLGGSRPLACRT